MGRRVSSIYMGERDRRDPAEFAARVRRVSSRERSLGGLIERVGRSIWNVSPKKGRGGIAFERRSVYDLDLIEERLTCTPLTIRPGSRGL